MFSNVRDYMIQNALPSYNAFVAFRETCEWGEQELVRLGIAASVALFHLREHWPSETRPSRTELERAHPEFGILGDIANASKHRVIDQRQPRLSRAEQIRETLVITRYIDEDGEYGSGQVEVDIELDDGSHLRLVDLLQKVMAMWCARLASEGIVSLAGPAPLVDSYVTREKARTAPLKFIRGERRAIRTQLRRYNNLTNRTEPISLSGSELMFRIVKRVNSIPMTVVLPGGTEFEFPMPLTETQSQAYAGCINDAQQAEFVQHLLDQNEELRLALASRVEELAQVSSSSGVADQSESGGFPSSVDENGGRDTDGD